MSPVIITGQAIDRTSGLPLPTTALNIGFATRGFVWDEPVTTDSNGNYRYHLQSLARPWRHAEYLGRQSAGGRSTEPGADYYCTRLCEPAVRRHYNVQERHPGVFHFPRKPRRCAADRFFKQLRGLYGLRHQSDGHVGCHGNEPDRQRIHHPGQFQLRSQPPVGGGGERAGFRAGRIHLYWPRAPRSASPARSNSCRPFQCLW